MLGILQLGMILNGCGIVPFRLPKGQSIATRGVGGSGRQGGKACRELPTDVRHFNLYLLNVFFVLHRNPNSDLRAGAIGARAAEIFSQFSAV